MNDGHVHFFSERFFTALGRQSPTGHERSGADVIGALGWDPPGSAEALADRWVNELDANSVARSAIIASVPGDEESVAQAVARHPARLVGFFMVDPTASDAPTRTARAFDELGLRVACLFPAMQRYSLYDPGVRAVVETAAARPGTAVFVHCGALSVGVRAKLGLPSRFDVSRGNPLHVQPLAAEFPRLPFIIPHFGAGLFHEALMAADLCSNVYLDTSSSNRWTSYHHSLSLGDVFARALAVVGPERLIFGTDSSFFPRGWHRAIYTQQAAALNALGVLESAQKQVFGGNFERLFPA